MDGFFLIDKPLHITSFFVVKQLKKILDTKKIGHTGTLDPLATGLLLVATGNYTKLIPYFEKDTKEYEFEISLDGETESFDLGTPVKFISDEDKENYSKSISETQINDLLKKHFSGNIIQLPPKYSALKVDGKMAVRMVKSGIEFELKKREVNISKIELISYKYPKAKIKATVSAGTYVRTIAYDLGKLIGTGAYVTSLRRTKIGKLDLSLSTTVDNLGKPLDIKKVFSEKKFIKLDEETLAKMNDGMETNSDLKLENGQYFVTNDKYITNIVEFTDGRLKPVRRIVI